VLDHKGEERERRGPLGARLLRTFRCSTIRERRGRGEDNLENLRQAKEEEIHLDRDRGKAE